MLIDDIQLLLYTQFMVKRENKWRDVFAAVLLFAAFRVVAQRLIATDWAEDLTLVNFFILFRISFGFCPWAKYIQAMDRNIAGCCLQLDRASVGVWTRLWVQILPGVKSCWFY